MQSGRSSSTQIVNGTRVLVSQLLREPVKEAVREAMREELAAEEADEVRIQAEKSDKGGSLLSGVAMKGVAIAMIVGVAYYAQRKRGGGLTESSSQSTEPASTGPSSEFSSGGSDTTTRSDTEVGSTGRTA